MLTECHTGILHIYIAPSLWVLFYLIYKAGVVLQS